MADIVTLTIERLKANTTWQNVKPLGGLSELEIKRSGLRTPTLFVFMVSENPKPDVRGSGPYLQSINVTLGVVIVDSNRNGRPLNFSPLRHTLRQQLFGWQPTATYEPYWLGTGRLLSIEKGQASWIDHFVTEYTADQNHV